jgi:hypothetical protein
MADKAQRTLAILTERLDRHRGAGQQSITVKHVTVNADNAIVGDVSSTLGGGPQVERKDCNYPCTAAGAVERNPQRQPVPIASDAEWTLPNARGTFAGRSEGK